MPHCNGSYNQGTAFYPNPAILSTDYHAMTRVSRNSEGQITTAAAEMQSVILIVQPTVNGPITPAVPQGGVGRIFTFKFANGFSSSRRYRSALMGGSQAFRPLKRPR